MELSSSRHSQKRSSDGVKAESSKASTIRMLPAPQGTTRDGKNVRSSNAPSRLLPERVELPSIRQALPEIGLGNPPPEGLDYWTDHPLYSPRGRPGAIEETSEYFPSEPYDRKRTPIGQEGRASEGLDYPVPRMLPNNLQIRTRSITPSPMERQSSGYSIGESWTSFNRGSPSCALPAMRSPPRFESPTDFRPTLPSLPSLTLERGGSIPRGQSTWSEYVLDSSRSGALTHPQYPSSAYPPAPSTSSHQSDTYIYDKPREQSYSSISIHSNSQMSNQPPYSSQGYYQERPEAYLQDLGMSEIGGVIEGTKHRKRRGNLPKETTDKLRAWFVAHLHHPYPTEDEKQELMRQTKLQMNQISNWFINARRRQLPAMINNARVESNARTARAGDTAMGGTESEFGEEKRGLGLGLESESEGGYDDDFETPERRRSGGGRASRSQLTEEPQRGFELKGGRR